MAREPRGTFLGIPYNFSPPRRHEIGRGVWDRGEDRILTPKNYGWGYGVNVSALVRRFGHRRGR